MESRADEADALLSRLRSGPLGGRDELRAAGKAIVMLIEVFRYPDETERRANAGHFGVKAPQESIPSLGHL